MNLALSPSLPPSLTPPPPTAEAPAGLASVDHHIGDSQCRPGHPPHTHRNREVPLQRSAGREPGTQGD